MWERTTLLNFPRVLLVIMPLDLADVTCDVG